MENHFLVHTYTKQPSPYFDCFDRLKPLKCTSCTFSTESLLLLRYHFVCNHDQQQHTLKATLKTCKKCGFCTHSNYLWLTHGIFNTCKNNIAQLKRKRQSPVPTRNKGKAEKCDKCDYHSVRASNLKRHIINNHTPLEQIDWQECKECLKKFKTLPVLKIHQKNVHMSAVHHFHCSECDYSTPFRHMLGTHFNRKHARPEEVKWVECHVCGAKFKEKAYLSSHLKTHFMKEKRYECDQCPFKTTTKNYLKLHKGRSHDDSAFKCDLCSFQATYERCIIIHKKNTHGVGEVTWLKCEHCDFKTKYKNNFKNHVLAKHNQDGKVIQCKQCHYKTPSKHYFNKHMKQKHKQVEATISCKDCSYVTKTQWELRIHVLNRHTVHNEEDKLNCAHCTYFCYNKNYMNRHLRMKHKIGTKIR